ncbi:MAG: RluA family pseudouridine synthase [Firmicutes bacterium]|nr:RluA family pseudouridine synthase [Bacillota bacterium]
MKRFVVQEAGQRLDVYLAEQLECTRSHVRILIDNGYILIDGQKVKAGYTLKVGQAIEVTEPEPVVAEIIPQDIDFGIIYEDDQIAVINKPQGLTVHPAGGSYTDTLVNGLMSRISDLSSINGIIRPGIVHRLDKDTSGVMVIAKTNDAHTKLSADIADRKFAKQYIALLEGVIKQNQGTITTNIARDPKDRKRMAVMSVGKQAITHYKVLKRFESHSLVGFDILTGRTHQIRVHAKHIGHPVVGDTIYGYKKQTIKGLKGQLLHAHKLGFRHPTSGKQVEFEAELPKHFSVIEKLALR